MPASIFTGDPHPAATVVVLRDTPGGPQVFMVRRHERTAFMGGAHVFPGGRVDASDRDASEAWCDGLAHAARQLVGLPVAAAAAYYVAASRELFEEAGVLLARAASGSVVSLAGEAHARFRQYRGEVHAGRLSFRAMLDRERLRLALDTLVLFAHWVTPPIDTRRFDTRFFITRVPPEQEPAHDETETTHSDWLAPAAALARAATNEIVLPPPTWTTLRELERFESVDAALGWAGRRRIVRREPAHVESGGRRMLLLPGDPLNAGDGGDEPLLETRFVFVDGRWRAERART